MLSIELITILMFACMLLMLGCGLPVAFVRRRTLDGFVGACPHCGEVIMTIEVSVVRVFGTIGGLS